MKAPLPLRLRPLLPLLAFLVMATSRHAQAKDATITPQCDALNHEKYCWHSAFEDFIPYHMNQQSGLLPEISLKSCWTCGLWIEAFPFDMKTNSLPAPLLFERAQCCNALGMKKEALEIYRSIIREHPESETLPLCFQAILQILSDEGNLKAVKGLYDNLVPKNQERLLPKSLHLVAVSLYRQGQDQAALTVLSQISSDAEVYPYALYAQAQIAFRQQETNQSLRILESILEADFTALVPDILQEFTRLTRGRIMFQQEQYGQAIEEFRSLNRSRFFLSEALMGMGWCYQTMGQPSLAIAYFLAAQEAPYTDSDTLVRAELEIARLFSESRVHRDSFQTLKDTKDRLDLLVAQYRKYGHNQEWLQQLAHSLLINREELPSGLQDYAAIRKEMMYVLERERHTSPRMKNLLELDQVLQQITSLFNNPAGQVSDQGAGALLSVSTYPPLISPLPLLEPALINLLNISFALLDTEYRINDSGSTLGVISPEERLAFQLEILDFYSHSFQELLLPDRESKSAHEVLGRLQSSARNLPFPLEEKERILAKILYTSKTLRENEQALHRWTAGMESLSTNGTEPSRLLLLKKWMIYVRTLMQFRSWAYKSPAVFLQTSFPALPLPDDTTLTYEAHEPRLTQRIGIIRERLSRLLLREIERLQEQRIEALERLLTKSQLYHAEALLQEQEDLQKQRPLPSEAGRNGTPGPVEHEDLSSEPSISSP